MPVRYSARLSAALSCRGTCPERRLGRYDFDVQLGDGRIVAVEVTISADPRMVEFWRVVHKAGLWDAPQLQHSWLLNMTPPASVKTLRGRVEALLQGLERAGIHKFGLGTKVNAPEIDQLHHLLVKIGDVWPGVHPSRIGIYSTDAGSVDTEPVRQVVEHEASKPDNRGKLARAPADERHLFVWIDLATSPAAASSGFMDVRVPAACSLPPEVDVAWVAVPATDDAGNPTENLWRFNRRDGWQKTAGG